MEIQKEVGDKIMFGVKTTNTNGAGGVWSYNLETQGIVLENKVSVDEYGNGTLNISVPAIIKFESDRYYASWDYSGTDGVDLLSADTLYTNYEAVLDTDFAKVGSQKNPERVSHVEIELTRDLGTDEEIKLYYRISLNDSFTLIDTLDTVGSKSFDVNCGSRC